MTDPAPIVGLKPANLAVRSSRILLEDLAVEVDIGFHDFEVGKPQRLLITVEIWLDDCNTPADDDPALAWNYDRLRIDIRRIASARRWNLQETFVRALFDCIAEKRGVRDIRIRSAKPDIYVDARAVGVEIASFEGLWPNA